MSDGESKRPILGWDMSSSEDMAVLVLRDEMQNRLTHALMIDFSKAMSQVRESAGYMAEQLEQMALRIGPLFGVKPRLMWTFRGAFGPGRESIARGMYAQGWSKMRIARRLGVRHRDVRALLGGEQ